ncbi:MAG: NAD(P)H-binding protein [Chloroflexi bacterium]|nr:NAD(P)H-binding protein [Chloroflexota bacterium]MCL5275999.1 NAD(P)H-binding protein [Chloroflexota bacterium]
MTTVLVTGGAGMLGRQLLPRLAQAGYATRGMSRRERPEGLPPGVEWASADIENGAGLAQALSGVEVIVHAASSARERSWQIDVEGTRRLIEQAAAQGVKHIVYISIVGIERIPTPYYKNKVAAEEAITVGGVPWTILRATQFHDLLDRYITGYLRRPISLAPVSYRYQPVDAGEVAAALCDCVAQGPRGRAPDMGGPEVKTIGQLIPPWLAARGMRRLVIPRPVRGDVARAFQSGYNTCPANRQGRVTWEEWLTRPSAQS